MKRRHDYRRNNTKYATIASDNQILHGSTHQGNRIFKNAGRQCMAMSVSALIQADTQDPLVWTEKTIDEVMMAADNIYTEIVKRSATTSIPESGFLSVQNLAVMKEIKAFGATAQLSFANDPEIYDIVNGTDFGWQLEDEFTVLFSQHCSGILIANGFSYGVMKKKEKFYFFNSHSTS